MRRSLHWTVAPTSLLFLLVAGCAYLTMSVSRVGEAQQIDPSKVSPLLLRTGLTPDTLAAAGLTDEEVQAVITMMSLRSVDESVHGDIQAATRDLAAARRRAITPPGPSDAQSGDEPVVTPGAAEAHLARLLSASRDAATGVLPVDKAQTLRTIAGNLNRGLPAPYLVRDRTEQSWLELRNALAARRIAERNGTQIPERFRDTLLVVEAESEIGAAMIEHTARLQSVRNTWATALPPTPTPIPGSPR